jgi:hypothetical protein
METKLHNNIMDLSKNYDKELLSEENTKENNKLDDNLSNNKVNTNIKPETDGNNVNVSICTCTLYLNCSLM